MADAAARDVCVELGATTRHCHRADAETDALARARGARLRRAGTVVKIAVLPTDVGGDARSRLSAVTQALAVERGLSGAPRSACCCCGWRGREPAAQPAIVDELRAHASRSRRQRRRCPRLNSDAAFDRWGSIRRPLSR